jgi:CRISPR-associated protein Cmr1
MALDRNTIQIKTLTPLWTGDVEGKCNEIKETGIIGSLRWWYEALVRGLGGCACDPTNSDCRFDYKEFKKTGKIQDGLKDVCSACRLLGCTGWSRRFRLEVNSANNPMHNLFFVTSGLDWWLKTLFKDQETVAFGEFGLGLLGKDEHLNPIKALLFFLSRYGGIGARNQYGFGQFKIMHNEDECENKWQSLVKKGFSSTGTSSSQNLPSIEDFFFVKFKINDNRPLISELKNKFSRIKKMPKDFDWTYIPIALDLRYRGTLKNGSWFGIREYFREEEDISKSEDNAIFGCMKKSYKNSSRVSISHLYKEKENGEEYFLKIWGILPKGTKYTPKEFVTKVELAIPDGFEKVDEKDGADILGDHL